MCDDSSLTQHLNNLGAQKFGKRRAPSVDKNGKSATIGSGASTNPNDPNFISDWGMGWFPGYAINLETGERLNMAFGENSALSGGVFEQHGRDMKWNPTSKVTDSVPYAGVTHPDTIGPVFGGQHYIYVFGHNKDNAGTDYINVPHYDAGFVIDSVLSLLGGYPTKPNKREIIRDAMWVNLPLLVAGHSLLESDATIRLRVGKTYKKGYSTASDTASAADIAANGYNKNLPMYTFGTEGIATKTMENNVAVDALDLINVVPNPYYAYSSYETNNLDNRIKITNLPEQCTISIYNLGGTLIRRIKKGEAIVNLTPKGLNSPAAWHDGSLDWDLKNTAGTPISSGVYIIHVEVPGVGEKVVKWFGITRPIDLGSF
jgi:hypothetical protein